MKEITATESYLELGVGDRGCQNEEPLHNCTTQHYIETFLDQCGCLPFYLRNEVISNLDFLIGSNSTFSRNLCVLPTNSNVFRQQKLVPQAACHLVLAWFSLVLSKLKEMLTLKIRCLQKLKLTKITQNGFNSLPNWKVRKSRLYSI